MAPSGAAAGISSFFFFFFFFLIHNHRCKPDYFRKVSEVLRPCITRNVSWDRILPGIKIDGGDVVYDIRTDINSSLAFFLHFIYSKGDHKR